MGLADEVPLALRRERRTTTKPQVEDATPTTPRHSTRLRRLTAKATPISVTNANTTTITPKKSPKNSASRRRSEVAKALRVEKPTSPSATNRPSSASRARNAQRTAPTSGSGRSSTKRQRSGADAHRRSSLPVRAESEPLSGVVNFKPLRAVIEERMLRRIRRNGLSEEMNLIEAENRQRKRLLRQQLADLKKELELKDSEIENIRNESMLSASQAEEQDAARKQVLDLQRQIEELKEELSRSNMTTPVDGSAFTDWSQMSQYRHDDVSSVVDSHSNVDSHSQSSQVQYDDDHIMADDANDDDEFGDETIQDLEQCGTPRPSPKPQAQPRHNILTPPTTSPTGVAVFQAPINAAMMAAHEQLIDHAAELEQEVSTLRAQADETEIELELYSKFMKTIQTRLGDYRVDLDMNSIKSSITSSLDALESNLNERRTTIENITKSLRGLGFAGNSADEVVQAIHQAFQNARSEISFLPPHNVDLPETANPADIFDMALTQLRDLSHRIREDEEIIDQAHETENQLRQQLADRSANGAVDHTRLAEAHTNLAKQHEMILGLENELNQLRAEMSGRTSEVESLKRDVLRLAHEGTSARNALTQRENSVTELEGKLSILVRETEELREALQAAHNAHSAHLSHLIEAQEAEMSGLHEKHQQKLAILQERRLADITARDQQIAAIQKERSAQLTAMHEQHSVQISQLQEQHVAQITALQEQRSSEVAAVQEELTAQLHATQEQLTAELNAVKDEADAELAALQEERNAEVATLRDFRIKEIASLNEKRTAEILERDQKISALSAEISRLTADLIEANNIIAALREENKDLETDLEDQRVQANTMIDAVREDLQNALMRSQKFLLAPRERKSASAVAPVTSAPAKKQTAAEKGGLNRLFTGLQRAGAYLPKSLPSGRSVDMPTSDSAIALDNDDTLIED